jgi:hypothetical protein
MRTEGGYIFLDWSVKFRTDAVGIKNKQQYGHECGPGSVVGNSDWLRAGRSGYRIPVGARFSAPAQTGPGVHPASYTMYTGPFPVVKSGWGVTLIPHPLLVSLVMKE